jgi:hypothetical protein
VGNVRSILVSVSRARSLLNFGQFSLLGNVIATHDGANCPRCDSSLRLFLRQRPLKETEKKVRPLICQLVSFVQIHLVYCFLISLKTAFKTREVDLLLRFKIAL